MATTSTGASPTFQPWLWLQSAAEMWRKWREGLPDDKQEGVELGTFRVASCPSLTKFRLENASPASPTMSDVEAHFHTSENNTHRLNATSNEKQSPEEPALNPSEYSTAFQSLEALKTTIKDIPEPPLKDSIANRFLIRTINGTVPEMYYLTLDDVDHFRQVCCDGVLPCLLANTFIMPDMVDTRALNVPIDDEKLTSAERRQNHILCLNSLASVSQNQRSATAMSPEALARGDTRACMELLWTIVDLATVDRINVHRFPALRALQEENEDIYHFLQLTPSQLLLRWTNFMFAHSTVTGVPRTVENIGNDFAEAEIFLQLQASMNPEMMEIDQTEISSSERVLSNCVTMGIDVIHSTEELLSGDEHLNSIFLSQLFCSNPCLTYGSDGDDFETEVEKFDDEGSREERTFRMWLNSLGCQTMCASLFSPDFRSGWMLLEVLESILPKSIDWGKTNKPPFKPIVARIKSVENCNQVIEVAKKELNLSLVGIGGDDIAGGKRKPILALVWQLLRLHTLMILDSALESASPHRFSLSPKADSARKLNEADVLSWANNMLDFSGSRQRITSFKDPDLSNALALLDLLKSIEPHSIQDRHVTLGLTPEEKEMNAKYLLSVARKLGATIFIIWEDITEVKPKMILLLIASFMLLDKQLRKMHRSASVYHHRLLKSPGATPRSVTGQMEALVS